MNELWFYCLDVMPGERYNGDYIVVKTDEHSEEREVLFYSGTNYLGDGFKMWKTNGMIIAPRHTPNGDD